MICEFMCLKNWWFSPVVMLRMKNNKITYCRPLLHGIFNSFLCMSLLKNLIFARRLRRKKSFFSSCHITHRQGFLGRLRSLERGRNKFGEVSLHLTRNPTRGTLVIHKYENYGIHPVVEIQIFNWRTWCTKFASTAKSLGLQTKNYDKL